MNVYFQKYDMLPKSSGCLTSPLDLHDFKFSFFVTSPPFTTVLLVSPPSDLFASSTSAGAFYSTRIFVYVNVFRLSAGLF